MPSRVRRCVLELTWRLTHVCGSTHAHGSHIWIVGSYYKFSADWADTKALDISPKGGMPSDPMFVVQGTK